MDKFTNLSPADRFGLLAAQISDLEIEQKKVRDEIIATGLKVVDGDLYHITVSDPYTRKSPDKVLKSRIDELVKKYLSVQFVTAHTNESEPIVTVKAFARKKEAA